MLFGALLAELTRGRVEPKVKAGFSPSKPLLEDCVIKRLTTLFALVSLFAFMSVAQAKEEGGGTAKIAEHQWGMNFAIPTGNEGTFGLGYVLTPVMLLEFDVGFSYIKDGYTNPKDGKKEAMWGYLLGPAIR